MDLINMVLNWMAPPFTFFTLCVLLPPYQMLKWFLSFLAPFSAEDVDGRVVFITGASSGIGEFVAYEYAKRGACLALSARRERGLREVADRCADLGSPDPFVMVADVSKEEDCRRMIDSTITHFGRLDHLVNNAGITSVSLFEEWEEVTDLRPVMDINFWGSVYMTRYAIPHLRNSRGRIVVLSSSSSWLPVPRESVYNASKAALLALFETLRVELWPEVKITTVTPGIIESEFTQGKMVTRGDVMTVDPDMRDVQVGLIPVVTTPACAKAIVNAACRGERCVVVPSWFNVTKWLMMFCPEIVEWGYWLFYLTRREQPSREALSKRMLDATGARAFLYPSSIIYGSEVKTE